MTQLYWVPQSALVRVVLQRVSRASVSVDGSLVSGIGRGLCLLVGIQAGDDEVELQPQFLVWSVSPPVGSLREISLSLLAEESGYGLGADFTDLSEMMAEIRVGRELMKILDSQSWKVLQRFVRRKV